VQLALLVVLVVLITIAGTLFEERGVILTMIILVYALTSVVGGYASGSHYSRSDGKVYIPVVFMSQHLSSSTALHLQTQSFVPGCASRCCSQDIPAVTWQ
jgi:Endomembrane protein 70